MRFFKIQILSYVASIQILLEKQKAFFLSFLNVIQLLEKKYHLYEFFGEHSRLLTLWKTCTQSAVVTLKFTGMDLANRVIPLAKAELNVLFVISVVLPLGLHLEEGRPEAWPILEFSAYWTKKAYP
jgi:hypothetical protein